MHISKFILSAALVLSASAAMASGTGTVCNQQAPVSHPLDKTAYIPKIKTKTAPSQEQPAPVKASKGLRG